jgi:hypothetical protein
VAASFTHHGVWLDSGHGKGRAGPWQGWAPSSIVVAQGFRGNSQTRSELTPKVWRIRHEDFQAFVAAAERHAAPDEQERLEP